MFRSPALKIPDYRRLWLGAACNHLGMSGEQVIIGLLVFQITQSTAWVGAAIALYFLPLFVFGVLSGAIADRLDRRSLLRRIEFCLGLNLALFAALAAAGALQLWVVFVFIAISGSLRALHQPVRVSYAYDVAGGAQIVGSLSLLNLGVRSGQLIGALMAGYAMEHAGTSGAFLSLAGIHLIAFVLFCRLRSVGLADPSSRVPLRQNLREFFGEMRVNRVLTMLVIVTASVEVFGFSFSTALPELATARFDLGAEGLGIMQGARALGGILASIALSTRQEISRRGLAYLVMIYLFGGSLLLLAVAPQFVLALAALLLVSGMATASDILSQSMMQVSVANRLRGRAMGAWVFAVGFAPVGHLQVGALAVTLGVGNALAVNGCILIGIAVLTTVMVPRLRTL